MWFILPRAEKKKEDEVEQEPVKPITQDATRPKIHQMPRQSDSR